MKNPLNSNLQYRLMYNELLRKFGTENDHDVVKNMLDIINEFDTEHSVVLEKMLGIYARPAYADVTRIYNPEYEVYAEVISYNEFKDEFRICYKYHEKEIRCFHKSQNPDTYSYDTGISFSSYQDSSTKEREDYIKARVFRLDRVREMETSVTADRIHEYSPDRYKFEWTWTNQTASDNDDATL